MTSNQKLNWILFPILRAESRRFLPILLIVLCGCGSQQTSESSTSDSTEQLSESESSSDSIPGEEGSIGGDIFVTDALKNAISDETGQPDTISEYGTEEKEEEQEHVQIDDTLAEVYGFSVDGKYFAFKLVESGDGYGPKSGSIFVIDVAKNEWATKPGGFAEDFEKEQQDDFDTKMNSERDRLLKRFNIVPGKDMGYEYGYVRVNPNNVVIINEDRYVLDFKSNNGMIDLHVKGQGKDILLQKDSKVPTSRGVVRRIRLNRAYVLGDRIAVLVEYDGNIEEGFENSRYYTRKYIVVTGVVPK